jgi:hypothetical protein
VYRDKAQYCVIFVSEAYAKKVWPQHELKQAQARAFKENREYILPVRLDDTEIPGLNATTGYIDLRQHTVTELQTVVRDKLFGEDVDEDELIELTWKGDLVEFRGQDVASFWPEKLAKAQKNNTYVVRMPRIRYGDEPGDPWRASEGLPCHDCAAIKGEYHSDACDVECCPACGGQALGCECIIDGPLPRDET